jgi:hypothetical protein
MRGKKKGQMLQNTDTKYSVFMGHKPSGGILQTQ